MPALTIKNIPEQIYRSLKENAKENHRSLNGEVIACLDRAFHTVRTENPEDFLRRTADLRRRLKVPKLTERVLRSAKTEGRP